MADVERNDIGVVGGSGMGVEGGKVPNEGGAGSAIAWLFKYFECPPTSVYFL